MLICVRRNLRSEAPPRVVRNRLEREECHHTSWLQHLCHGKGKCHVEVNATTDVITPDKFSDLDATERLSPDVRRIPNDQVDGPRGDQLLTNSKKALLSHGFGDGLEEVRAMDAHIGQLETSEPGHASLHCRDIRVEANEPSPSSRCRGQGSPRGLKQLPMAACRVENDKWLLAQLAHAFRRKESSQLGRRVMDASRFPRVRSVPLRPRSSQLPPKSVQVCCPPGWVSGIERVVPLVDGSRRRGGWHF